MHPRKLIFRIHRAAIAIMNKHVLRASLPTFGGLENNDHEFMSAEALALALAVRPVAVADFQPQLLFRSPGRWLA